MPVAQMCTSSRTFVQQAWHKNGTTGTHLKMTIGLRIRMDVVPVFTAVRPDDPVESIMAFAYDPAFESARYFFFMDTRIQASPVVTERQVCHIQYFFCRTRIAFV